MPLRPPDFARILAKPIPPNDLLLMCVQPPYILRTSDVPAV